jgi:hypothetical protein
MMAVKRNYGNFSKAVQKMLPDLVSPFGYQHMGGSFFGRSRDGWLEGFDLQQSAWGSGDFCVNIGIDVPGLAVRWQDPNPSGHGLCIWDRLSAQGIDGAEVWLRAEDKQQLAESLATVAKWLPAVDPWFANFKSLSDVARIYRSRTNLVEPGRNGRLEQLGAANYGFLLAEAGDLAEARVWLQEAERLMSLPVYHVPGTVMMDMLHEKVKGARLLKPRPEDLAQLEAVRRSLKELG